mgnify:CR=1 FL=1
MVVAIEIYRMSFTSYHFGESSALSIVLCLVNFLLTIFYMKADEDMKSKLDWGSGFCSGCWRRLAFLVDFNSESGALCMGIADVFKARPGIDGVSS